MVFLSQIVFAYLFLATAIRDEYLVIERFLMVCKYLELEWWTRIRFSLLVASFKLRIFWILVLFPGQVEIIIIIIITEREVKVIPVLS